MASHFRLGSAPALARTAVSSTTVYTSKTIHILNLDNIYAQVNVEGTPTGTISIQVSNDHEEDSNGNVLVAGNWVQVVALSVSGANIFGEDLNQLGAPWLRIQYTNATSTGHVTMFVSGKGLI